MENNLEFHEMKKRIHQSALVLTTLALAAGAGVVFVALQITALAVAF
jgi:hypothetical protein